MRLHVFQIPVISVTSGVQTSGHGHAEALHRSEITLLHCSVCLCEAGQLLPRADTADPDNGYGPPRGSDGLPPDRCPYSAIMSISSVYLRWTYQFPILSEQPAQSLTLTEGIRFGVPRFRLDLPRGVALASSHSRRLRLVLPWPSPALARSVVRRDKPWAAATKPTTFVDFRWVSIVQYRQVYLRLRNGLRRH